VSKLTNQLYVQAKCSIRTDWLSLSREVAQFLLESELVGILLACGFVTLWILEPAQAICQPDRLAILLDRDLEPLLAHRVYEAIAVHHEDLEFVHELDHKIGDNGVTLAVDLVELASCHAEFTH